jgi:stage II sporulation protein R
MARKKIFFLHKFDVFLSAFFFGMVLFLSGVIFSSAAYSNRIHNEISSGVIRLHVLAHSDSPQDQLDKFNVKLAILDELNCLYDLHGGSLYISRFAMEEQLGAIEELASVLSGRVTEAVITHEYFPTRAYGGVTLPAGIYETVRVTIGDARGRNWWCVLFPPLCLVDAAVVQRQEDGETGAEQIFSDEAYRIISNPETLKFRFKTIEIWQGIKNFFVKNSP